MTSPDRLRSRIRQKLEELIGPEEADTLVEAMLPVPWREVATKDDLRGLESALRGEIAELRGEMHGSIASVRGEIAQLRREMHGSFESVRRSCTRRWRRRPAGSPASTWPPPRSSSS